MAVTNTPENFWKQVDKSGDCWIWTASKIGRGYGQVKFNYKHLRSHRVSWELTYGPIPKGLFVLHKCDNPACVNPDHLELGTHKENMRQMVERERSPKGERNARVMYPERYPTGDSHYSRLQPERMARGEKHGNSKLTADNIRHIRQVYSAGESTYEQLAHVYGVSITCIWNIVTRKTWAHVGSEDANSGND